MLLGKEIRLNRIFGAESGRAVIVAMDHGMAHSFDALEGLAPISRTLEQVVKGAPDAVLLLKGPADRAFRPYAGRVPLILQAACYPPYKPDADCQIATVEEAMRLGADAIAMTITVGGRGQEHGIPMLAALVSEAMPVGLPVIAHVYPKSADLPPGAFTDPKWVTYAIRVGTELGVDVLKVPYTGTVESFAACVDTTEAPVVSAGGPKADTVEAFLTMARDAVAAGAIGLTCGRNVWQSRNIPALITALRQVVHQGRDVAEIIADL
jgi:DhnA family fructose-bisphosphate aldolase class Ia